MKKIIILVAIAFLSINGFAQSTPTDLATAYLEKRAPVTPAAYQFLKFTDYPVDYNTGLPQINVPLYNVTCGKLSLPISVSYHGAGFRPGEQAGIMGLGWQLNAGGRVTRIKMGMEDDLYCFLGKRKGNTFNNHTWDSYNYLSEIERGQADGQYDIFTYQAGNSLSGRFLLKDTNTGGTTPKIAVPFQCEPVKISFNPFTIQRITFGPNGEKTVSGVSSGGIDYINIVDDAGILYRFGKSLSDGVEYQDLSQNTVQGGLFEPSYVSSWMLSEIISADKADTIFFKYSVQQINSLISTAASFTAYRDHFCMHRTGCSGLSPTYSTASPGVFSTQNQSLLTQIKFRDGVLNFSYAHFGGPAFSDQLQHITLVNKQNETIRKYVFRRESYTNDFADRALLKSIVPYNNNNDSTNPYKFTYNAGGGDLTSIDFWGYNNGANNSNLFSSTWTYTNYPGVIQIPMGPANRQPNEQAMKVYQLNRVEYPTGGYSDFVFESNRVEYFGQGIKLVGGLRIKEINTNDGNGLITKKTYKYGVNESGGGQLLIDGYNQNSFTQQLRAYYKHYSSYHSDFRYESRKITTTSLTDGSGMLSSVAVVYPEVTEYIGDETTNIGKTVYKYFTLGATDFYTGTPFGGLASFSHYLKYIGNWGRSALYEKSIHKNNNGTYELQNQEKYFYENFYKDTLKGLPVIKDVAHDYNGFDIGPSDQLWLDTYGVPYSWADAYYYMIARKPAKTINYTYTTGGTIIDTLVYTYGSNHLYPVQARTRDSKAEPVVSYFRYPQDKAQLHQIEALSATAQEAIDSMIKRNIVSPLIEKEMTVADIFQNRARVNYKIWDANKSIIAKENVRVKILTNPVEERITFLGYDNNSNMLEQHKTGDVREILLWGYNKQYVVAKIVGSDYATVTALINQSILDNPASDGALRTELNKLRVLNNCLVTTYTYKRLIGMTSETDPNGRTTYYSYDSFGRLSLILDKDMNVVKKFCYNYTGQPENCTSPSYTNDQQQATFTKTGCGGLVAPTYTYTVPAGTYTSFIDKGTANQSAINEMNTNGQAAANALSCLAGLTATNTTTLPWNVTVSNATFNQTYSINPMQTNLLLANIPVGTYTLVIAPISGSSSSQLILNSTTYTGTSFNIPNVSINAATSFTLQPPPSTSCTFSAAMGTTIATSSITNTGGTVSFYIVFQRNTSMTSGNTYTIASVSSGCRPSVQRTINFSSGGRNWTVTIFPTGQMSWHLLSGSPIVNANSTIGSPTLSYSL